MKFLDHRPTRVGSISSHHCLEFKMVQPQPMTLVCVSSGATSFSREIYKGLSLDLLAAFSCGIWGREVEARGNFCISHNCMEELGLRDPVLLCENFVSSSLA